jgi:predicted TIM-barrel fold metal-dependent hydrolase
MRAEDLILISVDDHICEPADMFDGHVPEKYRELAPVVRDEKGGEVQQWYYGDIRGRNLGLNAVAGKPPELYNVDALRYEAMRPGCYDVDARVRDMNAGGQLAGLNFPNWTGFAGQVLNQGPDADVNEAMIRAYNDWHIDTWCGAHPGRFIPLGLVPWFDVERAVAEVQRLADKGCHAITFPENPEPLGQPSLHTDHWDRLFAVCQDLGTVVCMHIGSSGKSAFTSHDAPASVPMTLSGMSSAYAAGDLVWGDWWERFPDLRFALSEGDIGWLPHFLQRADHVYRRHHGWTQARFPEGALPSETFLERVYVCFIQDPVGAELIGHLNEDMICWESDFPHSDSTWPDAPEHLMETIDAGLTDEQADKILHLNAMRAFQFDPFSVRPREQCTVAALRAESPDVDTVTHVGRKADARDLETWRTYAPPAPAATGSR